MAATESVLAGKTVVVTRPAGRESRLATLLEERGATVLSLPLISIRPLPVAGDLQEILEGVMHYDWIVFTSGHGVDLFFDAVLKRHGDIRAIGFARIACIGEATAALVRQRGIRVELIPEQAVAESLGEALVKSGGLDSAKVLLVEGSRNRPVLAGMLEQVGHAIVDRGVFYETQMHDLNGIPSVEQYRRGGADAVVFTSASGVENFAAQSAALSLSAQARQPLFFSIGPITSAAVQQHGMTVAGESAEASMEQLVEMLESYFSQRA